MNKIYRTLFCLVFSLAFSPCVIANHIVGGEIAIRRISPNSNTHEVVLIQFWNENNLIVGTSQVAGNRDTEARLFIYRKKDNVLMDFVLARYQDVKSVAYQNQSCATSRSLKTLQGSYSGHIELSPSRYDDPAGYYIVWERCCRNDDINNIKNPGDNGMVFYLEFPPVSIPNSSPRFQFPNGQYICIKQPFTMNMAAIDDDGDELRYSMVTPLRGNATPSDPVGNNSPKTGYPLVTWENGFSESKAINGAVPLEIDQTAGVLRVTASQLGLHVFTILCEEFRNGQRIGLVRRDFQLLVVDCSFDIPEAPIVTMQSQAIAEVKLCPGEAATLETDTSPQWAYQWQINGLNIAGATASQIMVRDTGVYVVIKSFVTKCSRDTTSSPVRVSHAKPISAQLTTDRPLICRGDSILLLANGGVTIPAGASYTWRRDNLEIARDVTSMYVANAGSYQLEVVDMQLGCPGRDTLLLSEEAISVTLPNELSVQRGKSVTIAALPAPGDGAYTYAWSPADNSFQSATNEAVVQVAPLDSTVYVVQIESLNGCVATDSVLVRVFDRMYIPAAFSPNGDGKNDTFEIFNFKDQLVEIRIFNRWGEVIFQSVDYTKSWDGTSRNQPLEPGNYPYRIRTVHGDLRGEVLLLR